MKRLIGIILFLIIVISCTVPISVSAVGEIIIKFDDIEACPGQTVNVPVMMLFSNSRTTHFQITPSLPEKFTVTDFTCNESSKYAKNGTFEWNSNTATVSWIGEVDGDVKNELLGYFVCTIPLSANVGADYQIGATYAGITALAGLISVVKTDQSIQFSRDTVINSIKSCGDSMLELNSDAIQDGLILKKSENIIINRRSVDFNGVTIQISTYEDESLIVDIVTDETYTDVDLPDIVVDENDFTFYIEHHDSRSQQYGRVTDVPAYDNDVVTHRLKASTSGTRGEIFATIHIEKKLSTIYKKASIISDICVSEVRYDDINDRAWMDNNDIFNIIPIRNVQDVLTNVPSDSDSCYVILSKPSLSANDKNRLRDFFMQDLDDLFDFDWSSLDTCGTPFSINDNFSIKMTLERTKINYEIVECNEYYKKSQNTPHIMFDLSTNLFGDINEDSLIDVADAQMILNYYVYTLANSNAEPLEEWISKQ